MTTLSLPTPSGLAVQNASDGLNRPNGPPASLVRTLRLPMLLGLLVVIGFFFGFGGWAALAPLASAAIAPGLVSPDGSRRTVQHLEGGIIREILVQEGSVVAAGQPLVTLQDSQARTSRDLLWTQEVTLLATQARLLAEQMQADTIDFPQRLLDQADQPAVRAAVTAQNEQFETRRQARNSSRAILRQRIAQFDEQIGGLQAQIASQRTELGLIESEITDVQSLVAQGLERRPRLLQLQRSQAEIEGQIAAGVSSIARARQQIGETELQIVDLDIERMNQIATEMTKVRTDLVAVEERLQASEDVLKRTAIVAPVDGTVVQLRFHTAGGVIAPGAPILDIVPLQEELLIDAHVSPNDIATVRADLPAQVHLTAYRQRNLPRIQGRVRTVSADSLLDERTGQRYFLARVEVDRQRLRELAPQIELSAGMPAEVMIMTGERTALDYLLRPFLDSIRRSFREI